jgi:hypothetical protein
MRIAKAIDTVALIFWHLFYDFSFASQAMGFIH